MREKLGDCLPKFSERDRELLKNSVDFIGLNHYTSRFVRHATNNLEENDFYRVQEAERIGNTILLLFYVDVQFFILKKLSGLDCLRSSSYCLDPITLAYCFIILCM